VEVSKEAIATMRHLAFESACFFPDPLRKLFMGGVMMRTNVHQREESKGRDTIAILDDVLEIVE